MSMKYTAYLTQGGTVELELPEDPSEVEARTPVLRGVPGTWLMDDHGAMVNMEYVSALVPTSPLPSYVIDGEGDRWDRRGDLYVLNAGPDQESDLAHSLDYIEAEWDIVTRG